MSDLNSKHNRVVWVDVPVADLARAAAFYAGVLAIEVSVDSFEGFEFGVLEHSEGNGGCLVPAPDKIAADGPLVYMNANGRIRDAVGKVAALGGQVVEDVHQIGPHGCRALVRDSEGNLIALHSETDA